MCRVECCVAGRRQDPNAGLSDTGLKLKTLFVGNTFQEVNFTKQIINLKHELETTVDSRN